MNSKLFLSLLLLPGALALGGCATVTLPSLDLANHPANPEAESAPLPTPSTTLAAAPTPAPQGDETPAQRHDHGAMHGNDASSAPAPAGEPKAGGAALYACPMHPEVTSDKPARCPKCGMALERKS